MLEEYTYNEIPSGRTDTLVKAIEKIEKLEKQLAIAVKVLEHYENKHLCQKALEDIKAIGNENIHSKQAKTRSK